jgi:outer membrane autotransporter protein
VTGKLTVADTYTQSSAGSLAIQINGATAGTKYDQLNVTQAATLGGTLKITLGSAFTPTVGQTFTILTASSVSDQFATVNGLAINTNEHFNITYNAGSVVLTVASGPLPASSPAFSNTLAQLTHPALNSGSSAKGLYRLAVSGPSLGRLPASVTATVPAASVTRMAPISPAYAAGRRLGFHAMDQFGSLAPSVPAPVGAADASVAGSFGIGAVSAAAYNNMSNTNHMRFECGVDLKALLKTSHKQLLKGLWASPDSPDALAIGYMTYNGNH